MGADGRDAGRAVGVAAAGAGADRRRRGRRRPSTWDVVAWAPAVAVAWLVWRFGVNAPYWDDWAMGDFLVKARTVGVGWGDFFAVYNESRLVVGRAVALVTAMATGWDLRAAMAESVAVAGATMAGVVALSRRAVRGTAARGVATVVAGTFVFSLLQFTNWVWGFQFPCFVPGACLVLGLWVAGTKLRGWVKVAACVLLAAAGTYGFTNGMILWVLLLPGLWWEATGEKGMSRRALAVVWAVAVAVFVGGYFYHFHRVEWMPSWTVTMGRPGELVKFTLVFLGMPVGWGVGKVGEAWACGVAGAVVLGAVLSAIGYVGWRGRRAGDWGVAARAWPWVAIGLYAVGSAGAAALGRGAAGTGFAMTMRYVTFSTMLPVAAVFLGAVVLEDLRARGVIGRRAAIVVGVVGVGILLEGNALTVRPSLERVSLLRTWRLQGKGGLELGALGESASVKSKLEPFGPAPLGPRAAELDRLGMLRPGVHATREVTAYEGKAEGVFGEVERVWRDGSVIRAQGWAVLPGRGEPADCAILSVEGKDGRCMGVGFTDGFVERADVGAVLGRRFAVCGWTVAAPAAAAAPAGGVRVVGWAYDALAGKAYRLGGEKGLPRTADGR